MCLTSSYTVNSLLSKCASNLLWFRFLFSNSAGDAMQVNIAMFYWDFYGRRSVVPQHTVDHSINDRRCSRFGVYFSKVE
uniref:Secreted protein n=1 Tax=Heterorhabditis bacteriophora TaxID=37862 RepID=A0A1I7WWS8_HETBA